MLPTDRERWLLLSAHLDQVLDISVEDREAWLNAFADSHPDLIGDLRSLLESAAGRGFADFLVGPSPAMPAVVPSKALVGTRVGPYLIESEIGRGGMGSVWRAARADGRFEGDVAIKLVHASWLGRDGEERFMREGKLLGRLDHPHIARLIDAGVLDDGQPYLAIEYVEGVPIDEFCDSHSLDIAARVALVLTVFDAVAHAHSHLIVHRDIKPSNILVTPAGTTKLLDFGIAKPLDAEEGAAVLTRSGMTALTPDYAAPEQLLGDPVTTATDVYALGLVVYRLLAGQLPFAGAARSHLDYLKAAKDQEVPLASTTTKQQSLRKALAGDLDNILGRALKWRPADRYASVGAFADDLKRFLTHQPVLARADTVTYRVTKFVRRHRGGVTTALLMLAALIGATAVSWTQMVEAQHQRDRAEIELKRSEAFGDLVSIVLSESGDAGSSITAGELLARGTALVRTEFAASPTLRAQLMYALAELDLLAGLYDEEHQLSTEALEQAMKSGDRNLIALTGCALVESDSWNGSLKGVRERVAGYLAMLTRDPSSDSARIQCLESASIIERNLGDGDRAMAFAEEADALAQRVPSATLWGKLSFKLTLADAERSAGRFAKADAAYEQLAAGFNLLKIDNTSMTAALYNNWGLALMNLGQPARAATLFKRSLDTKSQAAQTAIALVTYTAALLPLGRAQEAKDLLEPIYVSTMAADNKAAKVKVRLALAAVYRELGLFDRSEDMLRDIEKAMAEMLPPGHEAFGALHVNLALLAHARHDDDKALREADAALAIFAANPGLAYRVAISRIDRAEILLALNRSTEARADIQVALSTLHDIVGPGVRSLWVGHALLVTAKIEAKEGHAAAAHAAAVQANEHLTAAVGSRNELTIAARSLAAAAN